MMTFLKWLRVGLWVAVATSALIAAGIFIGWRQVGPIEEQTDRSFQMMDQTGAAVTEKDLLGKPTVLFFGFTSCPEVCPTTLSDIGTWLGELGSDAAQLNAVFVSVDPKRDTVEQLSTYLSVFDPRIRGLTGTPEQLLEMSKKYRFYYREVPLDGGDYTMEHTALVYLLDPDLQLVTTIDYHEDRRVAVPKLRRLLQS